MKNGGDIVSQMLRACLGKLEDKYDMLKTNVEVDPKFELGGILEKLGNTTPVIFNNVKNSNMKIIGGMFGDREMFYDFTGTTREKRIFKYMDALTNPIAPNLVTDAPVKENIIRRNINLGKFMPIPTFHEYDSSSFITAGIFVIKDPETSRVYTSIRRFQYNGTNSLSVLVTSPMLSEQMKELFRQKKKLECAVVLGYDYYFCLASQYSSQQYGVDKYHIDGGLRGEPLEVVKCETVDLEVPAYAEIVLEGTISYGDEEVEGPFGELMGYYGSVKKHPVMRVNTILHRNDPILQISAPCKEEHLSNGLIRDIEVFTHVNRLVECLDVNVTIGGGCRFTAFVSINKKTKGDGKQALIGALSSSKDIKHVVVFDDDVDIFDYADVDGAIATRVNAAEDLFIIKGAMGTGLDPSHLLDGTSDKIGIDATKPIGEKAKGFEKTKIPGYDKIDLRKFFPNLDR